MKLSLRRIIFATNGAAEEVDGNIMVEQVSTDTRTIEKGSLFVALNGENFDGHNYAQKALELGAVAVVTERMLDIPKDKMILVDDTTTALLKIAALNREAFKGKVVLVTGSVGKTTTKEMVALVLATSGKTLKTEANLNNEIGFPQMMLRLNESYKYAVLEVGVDGVGQMLPLTDAGKPNMAVVTNIGTAHLEAFGNREKIRDEKLAIREGLMEDGILVLNADDPFLSAQGHYYKTIYFGIKSLSAEVQVKNISYRDEFSVFEIHYEKEIYDVKLPALGEHNILNAAAAFTVGVSLGIEPLSAVNALTHYRTEGIRQKIVKRGGVTIVEDYYNASPQSVEAAFETLGIMHSRGRKIAVISDMLELGKDEVEYHKALAKLACINGIDMIFTTGTLSKHAYEEALTCEGLKAFHYDDKKELAEALLQTLKENDIVWFKASRGMRLEEVIKIMYGEE